MIESGFPTPTALADDPAATLDQIEIANPEAHQLTKPEAAVEEKQDDGAVPHRIARLVACRGDEGAHLALPKALDEDIGQLGAWQASKRMGVKRQFPLDPPAEGAKRSHAPGARVRSKRPRTGCLKSDAATADLPRR